MPSEHHQGAHRGLAPGCQLWVGIKRARQGANPEHAGGCTPWLGRGANHRLSTTPMVSYGADEARRTRPTALVRPCVSFGHRGDTASKLEVSEPHSCARARRWRPIARAALGQTRSATPSPVRMVGAPHPAPVILAAVAGHEDDAVILDALMLNTAPASPPGCARPSRLPRRRLSIQKGDRVHWASRGRARRVGPVLGTGQTGAAGDGDARGFRDRTPAEKCRDTGVARGLRKSLTFGISISFRTPHVTRGAFR